jgi:hypothetical protein
LVAAPSTSRFIRCVDWACAYDWLPVSTGNEPACARAALAFFFPSSLHTQASIRGDEEDRDSLLVQAGSSLALLRSPTNHALCGPLCVVHIFFTNIKMEATKLEEITTRTKLESEMRTIYWFFFIPTHVIYHPFERSQVEGCLVSINYFIVSPLYSILVPRLSNIETKLHLSFRI